MKKILFAVVATVLVCSCATDNINDEKVEQQGVYREFTATIDDLTRVALNDDKTKAFWQVGDEIYVSDGTNREKMTVTTLDGSTAIFSGNISIEPTMAMYPTWAWKTDGSINIPNSQPYSASIPLAMKGVVADNTITFTANDTGAALIAYPLTGDITITKARLCAAKNQKVYARNETNNRRLYDVTFSTPLTLSSETTMLYFMVHGDESSASQFIYYTLDITTSDVDSNQWVSSFDLVRRKISALDNTLVKSGAIVEFPAQSITDASLDENRPIWKFGSKYATQDDNGLINNWGQVTQKDNEYGLGQNKLCRLGTQHEEYVTIDDAQKQGIQSTNETTTKLRFYFSHGAYADNRKFTAHLGNYRYFAVKWSAPSMLAAAKSSAIKLDNDMGGFRNGSTGKTGEISCDEEGVVIYYYNLTDEAKSGKYLPTAEPFEFKYNGFKVADAVFNTADVTDADGNIVAPTFNLYWAGFFNSVAEIEAFNAAN